MQHLVPDYVYTPQGLQANLIISISDDGHIASISQQNAGIQSISPSEILSLHGVALLPGFVNAHSHVFQRALRGHTHRPLSKQDSFWTWRRAMYAEAQKLDPEVIYALALKTYREMLAAGYTSVGEFHYVHHQLDGQPYADPNVMSEAVIQAGKEAGIRVVLLMTAYAQSGFNRPPEEEQQRFCDASIDAYLGRVETLRLKGELIGVAPHSVRAVPEDWFRAIAAYSQINQLPLHVHADEQKAEIEQCLAMHGCTPVELLEHSGVLGPLTTVIHATHANDTEIALLAQHDCTVCVCPTTEGDLGDGIAPYAKLLEANIPLSIGSDSNTRLDPIEELRWAEYSARMRYQRRRVLIADELSSPGSLLLDYGTRCGANSLSLDSGAIVTGMAADFIAVDIQHPSLAGWNPEDFLDVLFFGASADVIVGTWVQGQKVYPRW
ncbi:MAG: formimidoylglutamate deiminase [Ktedonobacteraceae bacterium]